MATRKLRLPKTLVIDRSKWGRGRTGGYLLADDGAVTEKRGKMCCLGFACQALGATPDSLCGEYYPEHVFQSGLPAWLGGTNFDDTNNKTDAVKLAKINDSIDTDDKFKERAIKRIFAKHGCKVRFVDGEAK